MNLNQDTTLHGLEDEYMDDLIRLAVKRERMRETEEILKLRSTTGKRKNAGTGP